MSRVRVGALVEVTLAEGPGARLALWVQGCSILCPGCCNPAFLRRDGGRDVEAAEIVGAVRRVRDRIEGVTLVGGEPFDQAAALAEVARGARDLGLSVMTFTGHPLGRLRASADPGVRALLEATDLLVDGPYLAGRPERRRRWAGSANQRFHFLTGRYAPGIELVRPGEPERVVELRVGPGGRVEANGWPELLSAPSPTTSPPPPAGSTRPSGRAARRVRAPSPGPRSRGGSRGP